MKRINFEFQLLYLDVCGYTGWYEIRFFTFGNPKYDTSRSLFGIYVGLDIKHIFIDFLFMSVRIKL